MFTYGVLQHQRILEALCGREFSMVPATLSGYRKVFLDYEPFAPCALVVPDPGASVRGQLLLDIDTQQLPLFDQFECLDQGYYSRIECTVVDANAGDHSAWLYAPGENGLGCIGRDWDEEYFLASGRLNYLESMLLEMNNGAVQS